MSTGKFRFGGSDVSGTAVKVYGFRPEHAGVEVSLGAWTSVTIDGISLDFPRDAFPTWYRMPGDPSEGGAGVARLLSLTPDEVRAAAYGKAAELMTADIVRQLLGLYKAGHRDGVIDGREELKVQFHSLLRI